MQPLGQGDRLGVELEVRLAPLTFCRWRRFLRWRRPEAWLTSIAFSNCATLPSICRIMTAVGVSSRKASGLSAAISAMPSSRRKRQPSPA